MSKEPIYHNIEQNQDFHHRYYLGYHYRLASLKKKKSFSNNAFNCAPKHASKISQLAVDTINP